MPYKAPDYESLVAGWWKPEIGDKLSGQFIGVDEAPSTFGAGAMQRFFGIRTDAGAEVKVSVNFNLAKAFQASKVKVGDRVTLTYVGKKGRAHNFEVEKGSAKK